MRLALTDSQRFPRLRVGDNHDALQAGPVVLAYVHSDACRCWRSQSCTGAQALGRAFSPRAWRTSRFPRGSGAERWCGREPNLNAAFPLRSALAVKQEGSNRPWTSLGLGLGGEDRNPRSRGESRAEVCGRRARPTAAFRAIFFAIESSRDEKGKS